MMYLLADPMVERLLDVPKTGDVNAWFGWVVTALVIVLTAGMIGLYRLFSAEKKDTREANEKNAAILQRELDYARTILGAQHEKIADKLGVIALNTDANHKVIASSLTEIREELRRKQNGGS